MDLEHLGPVCVQRLLRRVLLPGDIGGALEHAAMLRIVFDPDFLKVQIGPDRLRELHNAAAHQITAQLHHRADVQEHFILVQLVGNAEDIVHPHHRIEVQRPLKTDLFLRPHVSDFDGQCVEKLRDGILGHILFKVPDGRLQVSNQQLSRLVPAGSGGDPIQ